MKIYTLIEDHQLDPNFGAEHGVSFYIETNKHKVLFDVGQSSLFLSNARRFNIDLSLVDVLIISHGHYDHGGGLEDFIRVNKHATIYLQESAFETFYSMRKENEYTYIGLSQYIDKNRFTFIKGDLLIDEELRIINKIEHDFDFPKSNQTMFKQVKEEMIQDNFEHEHSLIVTENNHQVLFAGCAHKGILNIIDQAEKLVKPKCITEVFGGFHLQSRFEKYEESISHIQDMAKIMLDKNILVYYSGHCTGDRAFDIMKNVLKERLQHFHPGLIVDLNE